MACETLSTSQLQVVVGDNEAGSGEHADHLAGYNGVWSLSSVHALDNCFVPSFAGLNLEHLMDDLFMTEEGGEIFEPRRHPMTLARLSESSVQLTQEASPLTGVASVTTFAVREPYCIDMTFEAQLTAAPRSGPRFGFFWASYVQAPEVPALQFLGDNGIWACLSPNDHGNDGGNTVCHTSADAAWGDPQRQYDGSLAHSFDRRRFDVPLMFGRPGDGSMLYLQMFDQRRPVRLCMSPSGGGLHRDGRLYNPAWDFQYVLDEAAGTLCRMRTRVVYKPYVNRGEVEQLYAQWVEELGAEAGE